MKRAPNNLLLRDGMLEHRNGQDVQAYLRGVFYDQRAVDRTIVIPVVIVDRGTYQRLLDIRWLNVQA